MAEHLSKDQALMVKLTEIVLSNLENGNLGVSELAIKAGMSEKSLNLRLRSISNKTINQFIREIRLRKALELIQNEELTLAEISFQVGFSSPAYFTKCFHEFFGHSPGTVKKGNYDEPLENASDRFQLISKKSIRFLLFILIAVLLLSFLGYLSYNIYQRMQVGEVSSKLQEKSIAVLPFKNLGKSIENQVFIDGMMEEILINLSKIHNLKVVSRTSVEQFMETSLTASEIADKIDVNYIVEGSGQKNGNVFLLRVQLIEASTDRHIWAESYEQEIREAQNIFTVQSKIAQKIARELKINVTPEEIQLIEEIPTKNLAAYDFLLRGNAELVKYWSNTIDIYNRRALDRAEELYRKSIISDSTYPDAYLGLAQVYLSKHGNDSFLSVIYLDSMLIFIDLALKYDNHFAGAHISRGFYFYYTGQGKLSIKEFEQAIKNYPTDAQGYKSLSYLYTGDKYCSDYIKALDYQYKALSILTGVDRSAVMRDIALGSFAPLYLLDIAKKYIQEAFKLDDNIDFYNQYLAELEILSENNEKAQELVRQNYVRDSNKVDNILWLGYTYYLTRHYKESLYCLRKIEKSLETSSPFNYSSFSDFSFTKIAYIYWINGYKKDAERWFDRQKKFCEVSIKYGRVNGINGDDYYELSALYAFKGEKKKAYVNLHEYAKIKICTWNKLLDLKSNPLFDNIRSEPEFQKIIKDLEVKYQSEHERVRKWLEEQG
jgi:TolB-like protein/AraC-like DNA-binding protein